MKFSIRFADKIVGTLIVLALAILVVVIFMLGRSQRWFKYDYQYISYFESANGLSKNMAVQYKGFTIGHVKDFVLADDDRVKVDFTVFEEYRDRWVKEGSVVEVVASPIGLGNSFLFYPGRGINILDEGSLIPDYNSYEGKMYMVTGLATKVDSGDSINNILNNVNTVLESVSISLAGSEGYENLPLGQILISIGQIMAKLEPMLENIDGITKNLDDITRGIADPDGTIMAILDTEGPVYTDLTAIINSLSGVVEDVNRTTDVLPANIPVILNDLSIAIREIQDVLVAVANNPLLKGGIPQRVETGPGGAGNRDLEF